MSFFFENSENNRVVGPNGKSCIKHCSKMSFIYFTSATVGSSSGNSSSSVLVGSLADIDFKSTSSSNIRKLKIQVKNEVKKEVTSTTT